MNLIQIKKTKHINSSYILVFSIVLVILLSTLLLLLTNFLSESRISASSNYSVYFNGTTGSSIAFSVLSNSSTNIGNGGFTIEFWIKPDTSFSAGANCYNGPDLFTNGAIIFDRDIYGPGDYGDFGISLMSDNRIAFSIHNGSTGVTVCSNPITLGQWNYVAAVKNGNTVSIHVGIGGSLYSQSNSFPGNSNLSYNTSRSTSYTADPLISLGAEKHTTWGSESFTAYHYKGLMDELRISNVARSITSIPTTTFSIDANTVAMFRFENNISSDVSISGIQQKGISFSNDTPNFGSSTPTNTPTNTPSPTPTSTPTNTPTPTDTPTPTPSPTQTPSNTPTPTDTPTPTPSPTLTPTPTDAPSPTQTLTPTITPTLLPSNTSTPTLTPTPIPTPIPSPTNTPKPTNTPSQRNNTSTPTPTSRLENTTLTPSQNVVQTTNVINNSPSSTLKPTTEITQSNSITPTNNSQINPERDSSNNEKHANTEQQNNNIFMILTILASLLALGIIISGIITMIRKKPERI